MSVATVVYCRRPDGNLHKAQAPGDPTTMDLKELIKQMKSLHWREFGVAPAGAVMVVIKWATTLS